MYFQCTYDVSNECFQTAYNRQHDLSKIKNLSVQKPFHEAIGCALEAVRVTLEKTLNTVSIEKDNIKKEDIELNQVAARREIMNSENADWTRFVKLIK